MKHTIEIGPNTSTKIDKRRTRMEYYLSRNCEYYLNKCIELVENFLDDARIIDISYTSHADNLRRLQWREPILYFSIVAHAKAGIYPRSTIELHFSIDIFIKINLPELYEKLVTFLMDLIDSTSLRQHNIKRILKELEQS